MTTAGLRMRPSIVEPAPVTSELAALWLRSTYGVQITAATIRQWARRGHLQRRYDLHEVDEVARQRGVIRPDLRE